MALGAMYCIVVGDDMASETQLMKGILEGCILSLIGKEPGHGYRVVERLRSAGFDDVAEATVYPILKRLEKKGELAFHKQPSDLGPPRKVYALTAQGKEALIAFERRWSATAEVVDALLKEESKCGE